MKNLAKIFVAVVAGMFAFSCVTDATNDPTIEVGNEGVTELTIAVELSRTQLGDKDAEGKYALYWSEGDAIAVNGIASNPLVDVESECKSATFRFPKVINHPFHVVYPAPAEGIEAVTEGCYPVVIPATQAYTEGTFASGVAPMYGSTSTTGGVITLNHLTGILRLAPKGAGEKVTAIEVKAEKGVLAGTFDVNCTTGALTAQEGGSTSIAVTFDEPLTLGDEATPIYIAVPAGSYGMVSITLTTEEHGKMVVRFDSDSKPISCSIVRELSSFTYKQTESGETSSVFEIDSVDALLQFAEIAGNFLPYTEAEVTAPIDMTGIEWTPIAGFDGYTFNGGNYEIKGLTAPLFESANSAINNVKLTNVNIASNGRLVLGAVVCTLGGNGSLANCSTSGTITVSNPDATIAADADLDKTICYGGLVGISNGPIANCVNEINIAVNQLASSKNTVAINPAVGGVVGYSVDGAVTNCVNGNTAKTTGAINYHDNQEALLYVHHVAGVAGWRAATNTTELKNNTNYGAISYKANGAGNNGISYESINVGGVAGYTNGTAQNNDNYGTITVASCDVKALYVGGVISVVVPSVAPVQELHNHTGANITVNSDVTFSCLNVAGTLGALAGGLADANGGGLFNSSNDGTIAINASTASNIATSSSNYYRIGGVVGYINRSVQGCENKANGDITVQGNVVLTRTNAQSGYNIAGVYAYHSTDGSHKDNTNRGDINVYTNTSKHSSATDSQTTYYKVDIAGVGAHVQRPAVGKEENFGHITIGKADGTTMNMTANIIHIAGCIAQRYNRANGVDGSAVNQGNITINSGVTLNGSGTGIYIGGCAAYSLKACEYHNYSNSGNITIKGKIADLAYIGGTIGYSYGPMYDCTNSGAVTTTSTSNFSGVTRIGGVVGHATGLLEGVKNNAGGNVSIEGTFAAQAHFGGVTAYYGQNASNESVNTLTSCENHGNVTLNATTNSKLATYLGGLAAEFFGTAVTNCSNSGDITLTKCSSQSYTADAATEVWVNIGGFFGYTRTAHTLTNCTNSGTISSAKSLNSSFVFTAGGFIGGSKTDITLDNCHNTMKPSVEWGIKLENTIPDGSGSNQSRAGGFLGWHSGGTLTTKNGVSNSANIYIGIINGDSGGSSYGGIAGVAPSNAHSFGGTISNSGNIYYAGTSASGTFSVGGLFGQSGNKTPTVCDDLRNTGNITITKEGGSNWKPTAKKNARIGGISGYHTGATWSNAQSVCTITAMDFEDTHRTSYTNVVGAICADSNVTLNNCHVGGTMLLSTKKETVGGDEETGEAGETVISDVPGVLTVENYAAYLTGNHSFTAAEAKSQKCGFITSIDATPQYAN